MPAAKQDRCNQRRLKQPELHGLLSQLESDHARDAGDAAEHLGRAGVNLVQLGEAARVSKRARGNT